MPSPQIPRRCFVCTGYAKVQRSVTVELRDLFSRSPAFNGAWLGRSSYFTISPGRWATCEATVESMYLSFAAIRIAPQRRIGRQQFSRRRDLWRSATTHAPASCAIIAALTLARPGCVMADWAAPPDRTPIGHCLFAPAQIDSSQRQDGKCPLLVIEKASPYRTATRGRSAFG